MAFSVSDYRFEGGKLKRLTCWAAVSGLVVASMPFIWLWLCARGLIVIPVECIKSILCVLEINLKEEVNEPAAK